MNSYDYPNNKKCATEESEVAYIKTNNDENIQSVSGTISNNREASRNRNATHNDAVSQLDN